MKNLKWGARVMTTGKAIERNIFPKHRNGVYLGNKKGKYTSLCVVVVCEGQITPRKYHSSFWRQK